MGGRLLCLTSFYFVELMLTWVFFFFFYVIVIVLALEGREEVKVIILDGDQRVGHVPFFFIALCRKQSQSSFCLSSSRHGVWSLQGAGHAAEELLADKSMNMPTHTHTHTGNHLYHLADKVLPDPPVTHFNGACVCMCVCV